MNYEKPIVFSSAENKLLGILHQTENYSHTGVLVIVGGPQYRVGSHRQFLLLSRYLAEKGIPSLRFDYHGMGDSDGPLTTFEDCEKDIRAAIDLFIQESPDVENIIIWGLCDAASSALFYAHQDERVKGLVILNPWVRTEAGIAKAYVKHYYLSRIVDPELWQKILKGKFSFSESIASLFSLLKTMIFKNKTNEKESECKESLFSSDVPLPDRMYRGVELFKGEILMIMSGDDLVADEFRDMVKIHAHWQQLLQSDRIKQELLEQADHTFSRKLWRDQVADWTYSWIVDIK